MLLEIICFLLLGILAGTLTGLIPGIHINLVGALIVSLSSYFLNILHIYFVVFISTMAITHTFLDFIPSVFLGCPDTDTELSVLPGHQLMKKGLGYEAVILSNYGSLAAIFILVVLSIPLILFNLLEKTYNLLHEIMPFLLIVVSIFLLFGEKKKINAFIVFFISGLLGYIVLNMPSLNQPLFPLLTGLFGASTLMIAINTNSSIPIQNFSTPKTKILKPLFGALIAAPLCSFLPGLGSGQAAIIGNSISNTNKKGFLVLLGATNTLVMGFSFVSLYAISKTRTGAAAAISEILGNLSLHVLILILLLILISGIFSFFITKKIAKLAARNISKLNYKKTSILVLLFLIIIVFIISKPLGLLAFVASTLTGLYCISLGVRRTNMMGCLLIPTILLYLI